MISWWQDPSLSGGGIAYMRGRLPRAMPLPLRQRVV